MGGDDPQIDFTTEVWEAFEPDEEDEQEVASSITTYEINTRVKISLLDYKSFDGSYKE